MRIALTHVYCWPEVRRGAERYTHELAAGLRRAGHDVRIVSTASTPGRDEVLDVPVRRYRQRTQLRRWYGSGGDSVAFGAQTLAGVAPRRLDVWHAMSVGDAAAATLAGKLRPGLRTVYTEVGFPNKASIDKRKERRLYEYVVRGVDEFISLSPPAGRYLAEGYGRGGEVVGGGVDLHSFGPADARHPTPALLVPAALSEPRKNVGLVLEAAAELTNRGQQVEVWLAGPGDLPDDLSAQAREGLSHVTMQRAASPDELPDLYSRAWVTVLPSQAEVFGLVVLESMACGTPAVVLDDGLGPSGIVTPGTGAMCAPTGVSVADACQQALELAADPRTVEACRARAADYDWDSIIVPRIVSLYARSGLH
ncbi:MAG TPA: glycosyltransferase family 4 protein [Mycobacteriales bacterium]|jgi:glycosyltransferase involved in cell wall biosynthesis|nr:glycosyltransferase family 4 protein [Mycobacteriales bacterium]